MTVERSVRYSIICIKEWEAMYSIIAGAVSTAVIFYVSILYKSTSLALIAFAAAVLLVFACLFLIFRTRTLDCRLMIPIAIAECGSPVTVHIILENRGLLPCAKFRCLLDQNNHFLRKHQKQWIRGGTVFAGENSYHDTVVFKDYGSYEFCLSKIRIYDLTGLFYIHKKVKSRANIQVIPKMQEIGVHLTESTRNFSGDADVYDDFRPGDDRSELFQIREFQKGDKIQSIHWKLSVKLNELLVKEHSMPRACPVVFLLDYRKKKQHRAENVNAYLVVTASISFSLMDAGCPHFAAWYSTVQNDVVRARVDDEESLYLFLSAYMAETFEQAKENLQEAYQEKYRGERCLFTLQINENLELKKNQDQIADFMGKDWEKKLQELELIL